MAYKVCPVTQNHLRSPISTENRGPLKSYNNHWAPELLQEIGKTMSKIDRAPPSKKEQSKGTGSMCMHVCVVCVVRGLG